jgi:hypothetical protein
MAKKRHASYGDKRDYPPIDLFYKDRYVGTTTWARTLAEAKDKYWEKHQHCDFSMLSAQRQR